MNRPFFSLIIPCHNSKMIKPLFDSLTRQGIKKDDLEVIIVDDNSDDRSYLELFLKYDFRYKFTYTKKDSIHCPGNTRRQGMNYVSGKWLFFADHDDYFQDGVLKHIKDYIESVKDHTVYEIITNIQYKRIDGEVLWTGGCNNSWLHGKWYNVDKLIKPYKINFKPDLFANEDCYFNCTVFNTLIEMDKDFDYLDVLSYTWLANPNSLSNKKDSDDDRGYFFNHFSDFIYAVTEPFMENAINTKDDRYIRHVISGLMFSYFYYEVADYYSDISKFQDVYWLIKSLVIRIIDEIGLSAYDIVNYVYSDIVFYEKNFRDSLIFMGPYIPRTSFQDFIMEISKTDLTDILGNFTLPSE